MTASNPTLTVLMPVYNEEKNITSAISVISKKLDSLECPFEIVVVDDASGDQTSLLLKKIGQQDSRIRFYQHSQNLGVGSSIITGIKHSQGEFIIFIPADLAMDVDDLKNYLEASKHADIVVGLRSDRRDYSLFRKIVSFTNIALIKVLFKMPQKQFNHICLYRREIFNKITVESHSAFFAAEIMIKARDLGYTLRELEVKYIPRQHGKSVAANFKWLWRAFRDLILFRLKWVKGSKKMVAHFEK